MGKRKRDIVKLKCPKKRYVTFSKRRKGLYQKASTLCTLCDAQVAIIVLSPSGNPYEFSHPSVDSVIDHYLNGTLSAKGPTTLEEATLLRDIKEHEALLKEERERRVLVKKENEDKSGKGKEKVEEWDDGFRAEEDLSLEGLQSWHDNLMELREKVKKRMGIMLSAAMAISIAGGDGSGGCALPSPSITVVDNMSPISTDDDGDWNINYVGDDEVSSYISLLKDAVNTSVIREEASSE
ncbi:hypothetical protein L1049_016181 [Liquidambar formosana]|uniref:MADS-box domain-containing protein n=1 Tax=Liquidambar formosana TaxID=63359 RepID=A0AAP0X2Z3_LIQFO